MQNSDRLRSPSSAVPARPCSATVPTCGQVKQALPSSATANRYKNGRLAASGFFGRSVRVCASTPLRALPKAIATLFSLTLAMPFRLRLKGALLAIPGVHRLLPGRFHHATLNQPDSGQQNDFVANWVRFARLREITAQKPVEMVDSTAGWRFTDIPSPAATNIKVQHSVTDGQGTVSAITTVSTPANRVDLGLVGHHTIASQYPANSAAARRNFWQSQLDCNTHLIFDMTKPGEGQDSKSPLDPYYPTETNTPVRYGDLCVSLINSTGGLASYEVKNHRSGQTKQMHRYHYSDWPDAAVISRAFPV